MWLTLMTPWLPAEESSTEQVPKKAAKNPPAKGAAPIPKRFRNL
jgi:hypothetical protein